MFAYQSALDGYRSYDAGYALINWRQANATVSGMSHGATHASDAKDVGHALEKDDSREKVDPPSTDPHAGHEQ